MKNWKPGELNGATPKFLVLKGADLKKYLNDADRQVLEAINHKVAVGRQMDGKPRSNNYLVVNTDEPYAEQLADIMQANGHWGETPCGRGPVNEG